MNAEGNDGLKIQASHYFPTWKPAETSRYQGPKGLYRPLNDLMQEPQPARTSTTYSTSLSFTQGFLLGQLSICLLLFFFIKFFIFGEAPSRHNNTTTTHTRSTSASTSTSTPHNHRARIHSFNTTAQRNPIALSTSFSSRTGFNHGGTNSADLSDPTLDQRGASAQPGILRPHPHPLTTTSILTKTYYRYPGHQPESLDWFNVLIAQVIAQLRVDAASDGAILTSLTEVLNGPRRPDFLDEIRVTEISLGEEFPIFSNCRVIPVDDGGGDGPVRPGSSRSFAGAGTADMDGARLQACMDVDLADALTLGIETKLILNYPRPNTAIMPVALAVSVVRFSGTLSISFIPSPSHPSNPNANDPTDANNTTLTFSFNPDYRLELSTHSLLGSRSRLQDVPKIAQLVEARLRGWFDERCVEPRVQMVGLPSFWPRARNTREAGEAGAAGFEGDADEDADALLNGDATPPRDGAEDGTSEIRRERTRPFGLRGEEADGLRLRRMPGALPL